MYGAQTIKPSGSVGVGFENDVEMYGAQTCLQRMVHGQWFENDVEMYGAQTIRSLVDSALAV